MIGRRVSIWKKTNKTKSIHVHSLGTLDSRFVGQVFEQKKRHKLRKKLDPTAEDPNSLLEWLEGLQ